MTDPTRTTIRVGLDFFDDGAEPPARSADTIYYILTHTPHIGDFSFFGPFECPEAAVPSIRQKLLEMSPAGLDTFNEMLSSGQNGLESFQHIEVPLSGGHKMMVRLTREENPEVAAKLPGPTWVVVCVEAKPKDAADGQPLLEDMIICGAFLSMDKANEAARQVLADITRGVEARKVEQIQKNGALACVAVSPIKTWMVEVKYESGIEYFSPPNDGVPSCSTCRRPQSALVNPLKNCARCKVTKYCSKECQKDGWKTHRHSCVPYSGAP